MGALGASPVPAQERSPGPGASDRPNVVFVFIDDLGYGDLGIYRPEDRPGPETPHLDELARGGLRFTQFYVSSPICSPSRVGITTGQYPQRHRVYGHLASRADNRERGMVDYLDPEVVTIARRLKEAGYATGHFGKWHMGGGRDVRAPHPQAYGFDESVVSFEGMGERLLDEESSLADQSAELGEGPIHRVPKHEKTEIYVDRAIEFAEAHRDQPFYIQLWPNDVHDPFKPSKAQLRAVADLDLEGFANESQWRKFFAVLKAMDEQVGRMVDALDRLGLREETILVVTGDNGPTAWSRYYEDGKGEGAAPGYTGGLRGRKWSLYEGGVRQPLILNAPGRIPSGAINRETVVTGVDLLPTLADLAGASLPDGYRSDGVNLSDAFLGTRTPRRGRPIFWEYNSLGGNIVPGLQKDRSPELAMRDGSWKVLVDADGSGLELYDLRSDRDESRDLAERYPRRARRMGERLLRWYHRDLPSPAGAVRRPDIEVDAFGLSAP